MSHDAYRKARNADPRSAEYAAFAKATGALIDAANDDRGDLKRLIEAIDLNKRLWDTLAADCASPQNKLPKELRAGIVSLAAFVRRHSSAVMREKESLDPLIDVNRMIMDGLSGKAPAA